MFYGNGVTSSDFSPAVSVFGTIADKVATLAAVGTNPAVLGRFVDPISPVVPAAPPQDLSLGLVHKTGVAQPSHKIEIR